MNEIKAEFDEDSDEIPTAGNEVYKCKELIHDNLVSSGQLDLLKRLIQNRLAQTGWTYSLRMECIEYIKRRGAENVNVSHMIEDIHSVGRARFPEDIKNELYTFLHDFAKTYVEIDESAPPLSEADASYSGSGPFHYQSRDAIPDPGLGVGIVNTSTTDDSTNSSCSQSGSGSSGEDEDEGSSRSRSLTPQPSDLPLLLPENLEILEAHRSGSEEEDDNEDPGDDEEDEERQGDEDGEEVYVEGYDLHIGGGVEGEYILGNQIEFEGDCESFLEEGGEGDVDALEETRVRGRLDHEEEEESSSNTTNNDEGEDELMDV